MKVLAMWVTFGVLLVASFLGATLAIFPLLPADARSLSTFEIFLFVACMLPFIAACVYLAASVWLISWRAHATKEEVYRVAGAGPLSRFDHWLIRRLGPKN